MPQPEGYLTGFEIRSMEQRGGGAQTLPHDGRLGTNRETEPTTFETLTVLCAVPITVTNFAAYTIEAQTSCSTCGS